MPHRGWSWSCSLRAVRPPPSRLVVHIARHRGCDAMPMGLPQLTAALVGGGPNTVHELHRLDGSRSQAGPVDRQQHLDELTGHVRRFAAEGPF